jgi:ribosomal protein L37AE/L43A
MKTPSRKTSRLRHIICPACGSGELLPSREPELACCDSCGFSVEGALFRTLEQIAILPDAVGSHACGCGYPEMRRLPDGVYHCPACGSEVLPIESPLDLERTRLRSASAWNTGGGSHRGADSVGLFKIQTGETL